MKIKTGLNQWSDIGSFKGKVGSQWHDVTHVKSMGQWHPLERTPPEDLTITLGLDGTSGILSYMASNTLTGQTFTATFYDAQDQVLSAQTTNLTTFSSVTIPVGATKVELYDTHPTSTRRRIGSGNVVSVLKWAKREPTLNSQQLFNCSNLTTVPNEAPITTDMGYMFYDCRAFNQSLSGWDVSKVTNMSYMFYGCSLFNQDISGWDVSNVVNMVAMFWGCSAFNQSLSGWDVSKVTNMGYMFNGCSLFNQDISGWNVSNVTNMSSMFFSCSSFNSDLSDWNVSNVVNMDSMFWGCSVFNQDISGWCVSKITKLPSNFVTNAPLMTSEKLPVWGTCPVQ